MEKIEKLDWKQRVDLGKESSLLVWYPRIKNLDIPQIKTEIVKIGHKALYDWMADEKPLGDDTWIKIYNAMDKIGSLPVFMRTDQASAKHEWKETCYVTKRENLNKHLSRLIEYHELAGMAGELGYDAVVFREFLTLESYFTTDFYGDFPVNKEIRCFIRDGKLVSMHNYWYEDAVKQGHPHDRQWRKKLKKLNLLSEDDKYLIKRQLEKIMPQFKDYWSVDFAKAENGIWFMIDMARGEVSYHPENIIEGEKK